MTRVHLDEEPVVRKKKDAFTREGQKWSWDFELLVPVRDEDALRETKKRPTSLLRGDVDGAEHTLAKIVAAISVEINHWFGGSPPNFRTLYLGQIDVDSADFWTNRLLSSSSRNTAKKSGPNRSITLTLKSG